MAHELLWWLADRDSRTSVAFNTDYGRVVLAAGAWKPSGSPKMDFEVTLALVSAAEERLAEAVRVDTAS